MRKTREIRRLYLELKQGQRQIARSANVSQSIVRDHLERFRAAGLSWPLSAEMTESELERRLFATDPAPAKLASKTLPDFARIHEELQRHRHATLQLLWEEYQTGNENGYGYSRFCHHYQRWQQEGFSLKIWRAGMAEYDEM
jgi:transposase